LGAPRVDGDGCGWPAVYPLQGLCWWVGLGIRVLRVGEPPPPRRVHVPYACCRSRRDALRPLSVAAGRPQQPSVDGATPPPAGRQAGGGGHGGGQAGHARYRRPRRAVVGGGGAQGSGGGQAESQAPRLDALGVRALDAASAQRVYAGSRPSVAPVAPRGVPCRPVDADVADTRSGRRGGLHGRPARLGLSSTARFHVRPRSAASGPTWTAIWGLVFGAVVSRLLPFYPQFPSGLWLSKQVYCCYLSPSFRPRPVRKPWKGTQLVHRGASLSFWDDRRQMCGPMCWCLYLVL